MLLSVDRLGRSPVLVGQPVVGEMEVDLGGADRPVPGLGLDRFQGHAHFPQAGETGVAQLVTRAVAEPSSSAGVADHWFHALDRQRLTRVGPFNTVNTRSVSAPVGRSWLR